jgi:hypothetical protein
MSSPVARCGQRSRLEADAVAAVQMLDPEASLEEPPYDLSNNRGSLVVGVVEHLDLQPIPWIVEAAYGADESLGDIHFVEERQLDGDQRPGVGVLRRSGKVPPCAIVEHQQMNPVAAVQGQDPEDKVVDKEHYLRSELGHCGWSLAPTTRASAECREALY